MLIRQAEVRGHRLADIRIEAGKIAAIGMLSPHEGEQVLDARGGALLPGLHDHHIHLAALAAARTSVACGPPHVTDEAGLAEALAGPGEGWLRGTGYHESVAGLLNASQLDRLAPHRPVRIQHRSGRMWFLNSQALALLLEAASPAPGLEERDGRRTGRLFDADVWLREALGGTPPSFTEVSEMLTRMGVTGITDLSPSNDAATAAHLVAQQRSGGLHQRCVLGGTLGLAEAGFDTQLTLGPAKLHLHENALPDLGQAIEFILSAHRQARHVAIHCVTETELVFALAALESAGAFAGGRIEHASIAPDHLINEMARLELSVVSQPHFIAERGDHYLREIEPRDWRLIYRLAGLRRAGITLAGGSDAPFGSCDPWAAMRAAVSRLTADRQVIGADEALTPEEALALYLADPHDLSAEREIVSGGPADLCLLARPWAEARGRLRAEDVRATLIAGSIVYDSVDQPPGACGPRIDSPA